MHDDMPWFHVVDMAIEVLNYLRQHGQRFELSKDADWHEWYRLHPLYSDGPGNCYWNADRVCSNEGDDFLYYEGITWSSNLKISHAWNVKNGKLIDITLDPKIHHDRSKEIQNSPHTHLYDLMYVGINIPSFDVVSIHAKRSQTGSVLEDYLRQEALIP